MDWLFMRYANPFILLDQYIQNGRFCEFIVSFVEQKRESEYWEFFLHKVWDKSFTDFTASVQNDHFEQEMSEDDIETTVKNSMRILESLNMKEEA